MRLLSLLAVFRDVAWERRMGGVGDDTGGCFKVKSPIDGGDLRIIVSIGLGWDHVTVSRANRCPNWPEMERVKRLFFRDDETAMQLHVPPADHINCHPHCLHIWRPHDAAIQMPPAWMVGAQAEAAVVEPTEAMCDAARGLIMMDRFGLPSAKTPLSECARSGFYGEHWAHILDDDEREYGHRLPKGHLASLIWRAMESARHKQPDGAA